MEHSTFSMNQLEIEADYFGLDELLQVIRDLIPGHDDGNMCKGLIIVNTSRSEVTGPIWRLRIDDKSPNTVHHIKARESLWGDHRALWGTTSGILRGLSKYGRINNMKTFAADDENFQENLKNKRSVWFCVNHFFENDYHDPNGKMENESSSQNRPRLSDMRVIEDKIMKSWELYWEIAEEGKILKIIY